MLHELLGFYTFKFTLTIKSDCFFVDLEHELAGCRWLEARRILHLLLQLPQAPHVFYAWWVRFLCILDQAFDYEIWLFFADLEYDTYQFVCLHFLIVQIIHA